MAHDPEVRAAVMAALLQGQAVTAVAEEYNCGPFRFAPGCGASPQVVIYDRETGADLERRPGGVGPVTLRLPDNGREEVSRG